jgi:hypothetical protein
MAEIKYDPSHHAGKNAEERIASRLKGSGIPGQGGSATQGSGPTRTITTFTKAARSAPMADLGLVRCHPERTMGDERPKRR